MFITPEPSQTTKPSFLYVEDDTMSRLVVQTLLKRVLGYEKLTIFETSRDFMGQLETLEYVPSIILLDIQMRPHNGYELLEMLRQNKRYKAATIIALTANVMAHDVEKLKAAGFDGLIGKPIMKDVFPELIERITSGETVWYIP